MADRFTSSFYCPRELLHKSASAHAALQWEGEQEAQGSLRHPPADGFVPQPDYMDAEDAQDLIKPRKLVNPVKSSKSHQDLHKELLMRGGGGAEPKPELQRVLEARKREQRGRQKRQEEEARRKVSPLEQELLKRQKKLEELERQQEKDQEDMEKAPEFVKVKEKLRRTSFHSKDEKMM
ncbi:protein FAM107B [Gadus chalcogrammus]|uniref:protein FAM107B n=1 Tax=Gadus chalcogrammus TaxID=1042646 RepID=UPI0024C4C8AA|nr:protein FAM107B [Gadus chalcogrammus]